MIGLFLIYFLGKKYYKLAEEYNRSKWGFAILGIATYYAASIIAGLIFILIMELNDPGYVDRVSDVLVGLIGLPFGLLSAWLVYQQLKKRWENLAKPVDENILDLEI